MNIRAGLQAWKHFAALLIAAAIVLAAPYRHRRGGAFRHSFYHSRRWRNRYFNGPRSRLPPPPLLWAGQGRKPRHIQGWRDRSERRRYAPFRRRRELADFLCIHPSRRRLPVQMLPVSEPPGSAASLTSDIDKKNAGYCAASLAMPARSPRSRP